MTRLLVTVAHPDDAEDPDDDARYEGQWREGLEPGRRPGSRPRQEKLGAPDHAIDHNVFEGEHRWHGRLTADFLERNL